MVDVHHTRDAIKTETVELILVHPKPQVAQEKTQDLMRAVVEQATIP